MQNKRQKSKSPVVATLNWPVIAAVALLGALSLVLFFAGRARQEAAREVALQAARADTAAARERAADVEGELEYFNQEADEYIASLPADKLLVARMVDSVNHHLVYFEASDCPSCYIFDLETLTTEVLFGGENGFYCDTKLLMVGTIRQWMRVGDTVYFIAANRAPEANEPVAVYVLSLDLPSRAVGYVDSGSDAEFLPPDRLRISHATLLYHSLFTGEDVYSHTTVTRQL